MEKTYKFKLNPTEVQAERIEITFGCCRYVYNYFLNLYKTRYETSGEKFDVYKCLDELKLLKRQFIWLGGVNARALVNSVNELNVYLTKYYKGDPSNTSALYFKSKKSIRQAYQPTPNGIKLLEGRKVLIPSIGAVKAKISRDVEGTVSAVSVVRMASGYYVIIKCSGVSQKALPAVGNVGVVSAPKTDSKNENRIRSLQRRLSRKTIGGSNWVKLRLQIAKMKERLSNKEKDVFHKMSSKAVRENDVIVIEGILPDVLYGLLKYKARWYGRTLKK